MLHERASASRSEAGPRAARRPREVLEVRVRVLQRDVRRGGQLAVRGETGLQRGRGVDQLERRAGRVGLGDRPVRQHRRVFVVQLVPGGRLLLGAVARQVVRVVRRRGHHREDLARLRPDGHDGAGVALRRQRVVRGLLHRRVDRQHDVAAGRVAAGDEVGQPPREEPVVVAVEDLVLGPLDPAAAVEHRVVAGDRRVLRTVRVLALVAQAVAGLGAAGQDLARGADLAPLTAVLGQQHALVARIGAVVARLDDLHVGQVRHEQDDHAHHGKGDPPDGGVHEGRSTSSVPASARGFSGAAARFGSGVRAALLTRSRSATSA